MTDPRAAGSNRRVHHANPATPLGAYAFLPSLHRKSLSTCELSGKLPHLPKCGLKGLKSSPSGWSERKLAAMQTPARFSRIPPDSGRAWGRKARQIVLGALEAARYPSSFVGREADVRQNRLPPDRPRTSRSWMPSIEMDDNTLAPIRKKNSSVASAPISSAEADAFVSAAPARREPRRAVMRMIRRVGRPAPSPSSRT
jgi:hypothetical protein